MVSVFISYAHADERLKKRFLVHLDALHRERLITVWHDRMLKPGEHLDSAIEAELAGADLVILLMSPDFIHSNYCTEKEMQRAFARAKDGRCKVVHVILEPCQWPNIPIDGGGRLGDFLATPRDGKPVTKWPRGIEAGLNSVVADIRRLIDESTWPPMDNASGTVAVPSLVDRYRAEGRIEVDAKIVHGAPDGWFLPGNGKAEWFKDHEMGPEMVVVPAGSFVMGSPETEPDRLGSESPQHSVTIARPFSVGRHAVTRGQFAAFINNSGYKTEGGAYVLAGNEWKSDPKASWRNPGFPQDDSHPVVCVSWEDAKAFAVWLSSQSGQDYRLLTEAEWEYAARAGTTTPFWWGSTITPAQANYNGNYVYKGGGAKGEYREQTVAVGEFAANLWGLYQVHGNVWEWCEDVWHENYKGAPSDGSAWLQGRNADWQVGRGGSWDSYPQDLTNRLFRPFWRRIGRAEVGVPSLRRIKISIS